MTAAADFSIRWRRGHHGRKLGAMTATGRQTSTIRNTAARPARIGTAFRGRTAPIPNGTRVATSYNPGIEKEPRPGKEPPHIADSKNRGSSGQKVPGFRFDGSGKSFQSASVNGCKAAQDGLGGYGGGFGWDDTPLRRGNSKSAGRKMASAMIAKIPLPLSRHIAATFRP